MMRIEFRNRPKNRLERRIHLSRGVRFLLISS